MGWQTDHDDALVLPASTGRAALRAGRRAIDVSQAMAHLRAGARDSAVDRVSAGYLALREGEDGLSVDEALTVTAEALGEEVLLRHHLSEIRYCRRRGLPLPSARDEDSPASVARSALSLVALAWANRPCPVCHNGCEACTHCELEELLAGMGCSTCGQTGWVECSVCAGTGWLDQPPPPELARHVQRLRRRQARDGVRRLWASLSRLRKDEVHLLGERRADMLADLVRLRAQLRQLMNHAGIHRDRVRGELNPWALRADQLIGLLAGR